MVQIKTHSHVFGLRSDRLVRPDCGLALTGLLKFAAATSEPNRIFGIMGLGFKIAEGAA